MSIIEQLEEMRNGRSEGVLNPLAKEHPSDEKKQFLYWVHYVQEMSEKGTCLEMRIDFDPKKWKSLLWFDKVHTEVKGILQNMDNICDYVCVREWGTKGGRLHYHGVIRFFRVNQTDMAKVKKLLKTYFGLRSDVKQIGDFRSYVAYMFKRFVIEEGLRPKSEIITRQAFIKEMVQDYTPRCTWMTDGDILYINEERQKQNSEQEPKRIVMTNHGVEYIYK